MDIGKIWRTVLEWKCEHKNARSQVRTKMRLKTPLFWDMTPCHWLFGSRFFMRVQTNTP